MVGDSVIYSVFGPICYLLLFGVAYPLNFVRRVGLSLFKRCCCQTDKSRKETQKEPEQHDSKANADYNDPNTDSKDEDDTTNDAARGVYNGFKLKIPEKFAMQAPTTPLQLQIWTREAKLLQAQLMQGKQALPIQSDVIAGDDTTFTDVKKTNATDIIFTLKKKRGVLEYESSFSDKAYNIVKYQILGDVPNKILVEWTLEGHNRTTSCYETLDHQCEQYAHHPKTLHTKDEKQTDAKNAANDLNSGDLKDAKNAANDHNSDDFQYPIIQSTYHRWNYCPDGSGMVMEPLFGDCFNDLSHPALQRGKKDENDQKCLPEAFHPSQETLCANLIIKVFQTSEEDQTFEDELKQVEEKGSEKYEMLSDKIAKQARSELEHKYSNRYKKIQPFDEKKDLVDGKLKPIRFEELVYDLLRTIGRDFDSDLPVPEAAEQKAALLDLLVIINTDIDAPGTEKKVLHRNLEHDLRNLDIGKKITNRSLHRKTAEQRREEQKKTR
jgi:hypothetical protein